MAELSSKARKPEQTSSSPTHEAWTVPGTTLTMAWNEKGSIRVEVEGHGRGDLAPVVVRRFDLLLSQCRQVKLVLDFGRMPAYDSAFRTELTGWALDRKSAIVGVDLLAMSKLVSMGATIANLALGGIISVHQTRAEFERAAQAAGLPASSSR